MEKDTKKKKSGLRKAMLPACAMLLASVLSLTTMTYAWFTSGNTANVGEFDMTIAAGGGLEISADGKDWSSTLDSSKISALDDYKTGTKKLSPVSTDGSYVDSHGKDWENSVDKVNLKFFTGEVESADPGAKLTGASEAKDGWVAFPLYFRNAGEKGLDVNLGSTTINAKTENTDYGHLAVRMAFVVYGSCDSHAADVAIEPEVRGIKAKIFEPNETSHTQAGIADYKTKEAGATGSEKFTYFALKGTHSGSGIDRYNENDVFTEMKGDNSGDFHTYGTSEQYFTLEAGTITEVVVFLWIEGQDADCTNTISSNQFTTNLQFTATDALGG